MAIPINWYLLVAACLFSIGLYGVLSRRNAIGILMCNKFILIGINISLITFWRYMDPVRMTGQVFAIFVFTVAAAEVAVGLALVIAIYRNRDTVIIEEIDLLKE